MPQLGGSDSHEAGGKSGLTDLIIWYWFRLIESDPKQFIFDTFIVQLWEKVLSRQLSQRFKAVTTLAEK